ncbi:DUF1765-domain-containing protein [Xylariaceae sp. FL0804]|nr:DUF1765-domain-containing protein [Xylariaceae sp. FL0804]
MMTGPAVTLTVPPAVESTHSLSHPSHSTSELDLLSNPSSRSAARHHRNLSTKSLPSLPAYAVPAIDFETNLDTNFAFTADRAKEESPDEKSPVVAVDQIAGAARPRADRMGKRRTFLSRPQSWMPTSASTPDLGDWRKEESDEAKPSESSRFLNPNIHEKSKVVSDSLAAFARRSWIPSSRSPSPGDRKEGASGASDARPTRDRSMSIKKLRASTWRQSDTPIETEGNKTAESGGKLSSYLTKIKQSRPQAVLAKGTKLQSDVDSPASSTISLAPPSIDTRQSHASETSTSTFAEEFASAAKATQARDPLWSAFKGLETDLQKLQVKSTSLRMNTMRTCLMPFLRKYAYHSSNTRLHHEDLERRAGILNSWWIALLDLLNGKTQTPLPGADRPVLLEITSALMMRPEWRQCDSTFTPLADRSPRERLRKPPQATTNESTSSVGSTDSAYLAESAKHNVKNMFASNLISQMAIVVEKMALRNVSESLVTFAGKACAYAFFFAPGIADVLVRLWSLTPELLRRMGDEFHLPRLNKGESDDIAALFPPSVEALGWTSPKTISNSLRRVAKTPLAAVRIPWHGPWISRWNGRDSDLFFIFCKYFYILTEEFLPSGLPLPEKARSPGFAIVSAQLLAVLDSTIHRQNAAETMAGPPLSDALNGADASAVVPQLSPNNSNIMRGMSENRLIALLKDFLTGASVPFADARHTFAETFMAVTKASAKRTSQFNHNACFTICDFFEESLMAYDNFIDVPRPDRDYIDWPFWLQVLGKILESNNSMSEIRVLSLLFSTWDIATSSQARKETLCMDWLLTEEIFNKYFTNWCPMVRAYYMRLLCWRVCRGAGHLDDLDAKIFMLVSTRLKTTWSHYLWLKQVAEQQGRFLPSTAPSFPTPGKRFMIIRTEVPTVQQGLMVGFDSSASSTSFPQLGAPARSPTDFDSIDLPSHEAGNSKKKWTLLGKVLSLSGNATTPNDLESVRRETAAARSKPTPPKPSSGPVSPPGSDTDSMGSSPTYDEIQYIFRFTLSWNAAGTMSPPNRILTRPRLPCPAQSWVSAKGGYHGNPITNSAAPPAPTRAFSGSQFLGLVNSAKNADPSEIGASSNGDSASAGDSTIGEDRTSSRSMSPPEDSSGDSPPKRPASPPIQEPLVTPVQPQGASAISVKYAGRALAEWSLVVAECNNFVDRRRDEGISDLNDVEVPCLGVEGFRKIC